MNLFRGLIYIILCLFVGTMILCAVYHFVVIEGFDTETLPENHGQISWKLYPNKVGRPLVVGFGIHNREQVRSVAELADGVVVGSAIVNTIKDNLGDRDATLGRMGELVTDLVQGTRID